MSKASRQLDEDRALRDRARSRFEARLGKARDDMTPAAIGDRVTGQVKRQARDTLDEAIEVADGNRAVVAGTIGALAIWFLRRPILAWLGRKLASVIDKKDSTDDGN